MHSELTVVVAKQVTIKLEMTGKEAADLHAWIGKHFGIGPYHRGIGEAREFYDILAKVQFLPKEEK